LAANAIEIEALVRDFGESRALDGVDLAVQTGGVFGLLGPNGAGKTTMVRILNGVLGATSADRLEVLGHRIPKELDALRRRVGVQTDTSLYEKLTGLDNIAIFARFYDMSRQAAKARAVELLERFGLAHRGADKVGTYSKGMRQKLLIARALVADPALVFLDEPTAGLDPEASHDLMTYIADVSASDGRTFFITSHRLEEMESACTRIGVLDGGRIVAAGSPQQVAREAVPEIRVRVRAAEGSQLDPAVLAALPGVTGTRSCGPDVLLELVDQAAVPELVRAAAAMPVDLLGVAEEPPTLEEAYLRLVETPGTKGGAS